jgi:hypothetical protein
MNKNGTFNFPEPIWLLKHPLARQTCFYAQVVVSTFDTLKNSS